MLKFDVQLTPTKEEIADGLERASLRRAGKLRLVIQTVVLAAVAVWTLIAFFVDGAQEWMSLFIAVVATVLIPVMWLVPRWQMQSLAQTMADNGLSAHMWVFEDGIDFGDTQPDYPYYPYHTFFASVPSMKNLQTIVLKFPNDDVIVVPKSALSDEEWEFLYTKITTAPAKKTNTW